MGNIDAAIITEKIIQDWQPLNIIWVGIAGGVKKNGVALGDIVVAEYIAYYERGRDNPEKTEYKNIQYRSTSSLLNKVLLFENTHDYWANDIKIKKPDNTNKPQLSSGGIASGEKVIANNVKVTDLCEKYPDLKAIDMEGAGIAKAVYSQTDKIGFIEIRAISDFADENKDDTWQEYARNVVAHFTVKFLLSRPFKPRKRFIIPLIIIFSCFIVASSWYYIFSDSIVKNKIINRSIKDWENVDWRTLGKEATHFPQGIVNDPDIYQGYYIGAKEKVVCRVDNVPGYKWKDGEKVLTYFDKEIEDDKIKIESSQWMEKFQNKARYIITIGRAKEKKELAKTRAEYLLSLFYLNTDTKKTDLYSLSLAKTNIKLDTTQLTFLAILKTENQKLNQKNVEDCLKGWNKNAYSIKIPYDQYKLFDLKSHTGTVYLFPL